MVKQIQICQIKQRKNNKKEKHRIFFSVEKVERKRSRSTTKKRIFREKTRQILFNQKLFFCFDIVKRTKNWQEKEFEKRQYGIICEILVKKYCFTIGLRHFNNWRKLEIGLKFCKIWKKLKKMENNLLIKREFLESI